MSDSLESSAAVHDLLPSWGFYFPGLQRVALRAHSDVLIGRETFRLLLMGLFAQIVPSDRLHHLFCSSLPHDPLAALTRWCLSQSHLTSHDLGVQVGFIVI